MDNSHIASADTAAAPSGRELVQVAVEAAVDKFYTYLAPPDIGVVETGQAVLVPLRSGTVVGYVMAVRPASDPLPPRLKPIIEIVSAEPLFGPGLSRLISFISRYYFYPPGLCAREILPGGLSPALDKILILDESAETASTPMIGAEAELLSRLRERRPQGLSLKDLQAEGFASAAKKLMAAGLAAASYRLASKGARPSCEWWLGPASQLPADPPRLGPKERELWELVRGGPPKPLAYYSSYIKDPLAKARGLAAKGLAELRQVEVFRDDPDRAIFSDKGPIPNPTAQQRAALAVLSEALDKPGHQGFLLFGVTGSGKTEVYLRTAEKALEQGREVLWLAPEIGLTMGLEGLLKNRFGESRVAVLHSGLTAGQRHDQWLRIRRGLAPVVLGARSAVFAPLENLGLVVVDEEHDWAYKQDDGLRYNGRDLARWRAAESEAVLVLGSATPSFESYQAALDGRLTLLKMSERPGVAVLPEIELVDQGAEPSRHRQAMSPVLRRRLGDTFARGEQALLFINRRGMANLPMCLKCGEMLKCPHCSRTLTLHGPEGAGSGQMFETHAEINDRQVLICHACGYRAIPPETCPSCLSPLFRYFGVGTEKLLDLAEKNFDQAKGVRLDTDSVRRRGGFKKILESFAKGEFNLLVGTQMAAKGHDFPNLTLVGVVDADLGLNLPDFRAAERTFQLLSQVSGRAGRAEAPGTVLIQTMTPGHPVLRAVADHDYEAFFSSEINTRAELGYPPFGRLAMVRLSGPHEETLVRLAEEAGRSGRELLADFETGLDLLGPVPSPVAKIKDRYRYQLLVQSTTVALRHRFLERWLPGLRSGLPREVRLVVDVDPYHLM